MEGRRGRLIIRFSLMTIFWPESNRYKAANVDELIGMTFAALIVLSVGLWLVIRGIRAKFRETAAPPVSSVDTQ